MFTVGLLGVDGAGKSALAKSLRWSLRDSTAAVQTARFRPHILYDRKGAEGESPTGSNPHQQKPANWFVSSIKMLVWTLEIVLAKYVLPKPTATVRVFDRYYHDITIDPRRYALTPPSLVLKCLLTIVPEPDLWVVLHGPPDILQRRKSEMSVEKTAALERAYVGFAHRHSNAILIDATLPLDEVHAIVRQAILERCAKSHSKLCA